MTTSDNIKHIITTKDIDGNDLIIKISLNDQCKNGHIDFAIIADAYVKGKPHIDRNFLYGGCSHDEILKVKPELKIFVDLHLSDRKGVPMYAIANGFFHLKEGKIDYLKSTVRCTDEELQILKQAEDELHFQFLIEEMNLPSRWNQEANKAISLLEEWTGQKFTDTSTKDTYSKLSDNQVSLLKQRLSEGYYTEAAINERKQTKIEALKAKKLSELKSSLDKEVEKLTRCYEVEKQVIELLGTKENIIFYDYANELAFNWLDSNKKITPEQMDIVKNGLQLPFKISFKDEKKGR